ncbi:dephospho-CoA kinase, long form [Paenarthrobacter sp. DKR-5]|uniref:dephospho-CoA kinase n=1 Tax=Paenarthrobacter sp. DKR-5 TaxID=2835535 RepID=UPI001BDBDAA7|nr:dephospho-CoA kinase [Paenarthrobacter sp. DKR-5]MBT1001905.1 dephospho-CoA kinase, long form [Paenarthrobacter sp. DKR-5]
MLKIGLTGGIASGKSAVASRFKELGAVLIDADVIAREVVEPGTRGLAAVVAEFGPQVLRPDGSLDRAVLGGLVFGDDARREALNAIVHPLVRTEAARRLAAAPRGSVVVQDIPLLVETGQGAQFHLVVVVDAPVEERVRRMRTARGMTEADAVARIRAQATDEQRRAAADVMIRNDGPLEAALEQVDRLWASRLVPFARNLEHSVAAARPGPAVLVQHNRQWEGQAARLAARLRAAAPDTVLRVDHVGSTAVPGLAARDVIDLQVAVASLEAADAAAADFARAGFPRRPGAGGERQHGGADPGRAVNALVRVQDSPGWLSALSFRDWLRSESAALRDYQELKQRLAAAHAGDPDVSGYAAEKDRWFSDVAAPALQQWVAAAGWEPPELPEPQEPPSPPEPRSNGR